MTDVATAQFKIWRAANPNASHLDAWKASRLPTVVDKNWQPTAEWRKSTRGCWLRIWNGYALRYCPTTAMVHYRKTVTHQLIEDFMRDYKPPVEDAIIVKMFNEGAPITEIVKATKCAKQTVHRVIKVHNLNISPRDKNKLAVFNYLQQHGQATRMQVAAVLGARRVKGISSWQGLYISEWIDGKPCYKVGDLPDVAKPYTPRVQDHRPASRPKPSAVLHSVWCVPIRQQTA